MRTLTFIFFVLLFTGGSCTSYTFTTLPEIQKYADVYPEHVPSDNQDWMTPHYNSFYYANVPSFFTRLMNALGLYTSAWRIESFKKILEEITHVRQTQKLTGRLVAHRHCQEQDKFYIIGDLYGAFHSLLRDLTWLVKQGILDNDLKIIKDQHYLVFSGNLIDRSPYNLETLNVVLLLMQHNPEKVFFLRGEQEDRNSWHNFSLKRELMIRGAHISNDMIPLGNLISQFFDTLPLALYLTIDAAAKDAVCISPQGYTMLETDIHFMGNLFLNTPINTTVYHDTRNKLATTGAVPNIHVLLKSEDLIEGMRSKTGLALLDQEHGSTVWSVFSSPVEIHQRVLNFFYDAFACIEMGKPIIKSTITLYHQSTKFLDGFKKAGTFNLFFGIDAQAPGFGPDLEKEFFIGSTMSLERGVPFLGKFTKSGMLIRLNEENSTGGVDNYLLRAVIYNDDYRPFLARTNIRTFVDDLKISLVLLPIGSPTLDAYLDYVINNKIFVLFPITGSLDFRRPDLKGIINMRASYSDEVRVLINHMLNEYNVRKFAFFYQDDSYGKGAVAAAHALLKEKGITQWTDIPYTRGDYDFSQQAKIIKESQPDAIGFFSTAQATRNLISRTGIEVFADKQIFGLSFLGTMSFRQFIREYNIDVVFGAVVPNPRTSQLEVVKEYRQAMLNNNRSYYDIFSLEAYIATSLLIETLKKIKPPFTREKILQHLESLKNYNFKGIPLNFDPKQRSLAEYVWIEGGADVEWQSSKINH